MKYTYISNCVEQVNIVETLFNPYLPSGLFHPYQLDESISILGVADVLFSFSSYFW